MTTMLNMPPLPLAADNPLTHVIDHPLWEEGGWYLLSNHMVMVAIAAGLMLALFPAITKKYREGRLVPTGGRNFFETIIVFVRDEVAKPVLGEHTTRYMPLLWTLFFFILFCNLLGLLPLDALTLAPAKAVGLAHGIYGTATANIYITAVLAGFVFVFWNVEGIRRNGIKAWLHHFTGGAPLYMVPIMAPVEFLGMFVKPAALAIRLFANMTAGHILIAVLIGFTTAAFVGLGGGVAGTAGAIGLGIPVVLGAAAIMVLELFVAFLQAYIFTFLTALFLSQMVAHHHEEDHHDEHAHDHTRDLQTEDMPDDAVVAGARMAG